MLFLFPNIMQVAVYISSCHQFSFETEHDARAIVGWVQLFRDLPFLAPRESNIRIDLVFLKIEAKWGTTQQK
jgi:hypothetical protein